MATLLRGQHSTRVRRAIRLHLTAAPGGGTITPPTSGQLWPRPDSYVLLTRTAAKGGTP